MTWFWETSKRPLGAIGSRTFQDQRRTPDTAQDWHVHADTRESVNESRAADHQSKGRQRATSGRLRSYLGSGSEVAESVVHPSLHPRRCRKVCEAVAVASASLHESRGG